MENLAGIDKLVQVLESIRGVQKTSEGFTTRELSAHLQRHREWILENVLRPLLKEGKIVVVQRRDVRTDGVPCLIPAYKLVGDGETKAKAKTPAKKS